MVVFGMFFNFWILWTHVFKTTVELRSSILLVNRYKTLKCIMRLLPSYHLQFTVLITKLSCMSLKNKSLWAECKIFTSYRWLPFCCNIDTLDSLWYQQQEWSVTNVGEHFSNLHFISKSKFQQIQDVSQPARMMKKEFNTGVWDKVEIP